METQNLSLSEKSEISTDDTFKINFIPKEKIKMTSKLNNNLTQNLTLNESFSISREKKNFYLENITSFLIKEDLDQLIKVNYLF